MKNSFLTLALFIISYGGYAQLWLVDSQPLFQNLSGEDGLSQNFITEIVQDYQGYLWVGTNDGLNQYDGLGFKVYYHNNNDSLSISSNRVESIFESSDSTLWIGTDDGFLNKYNRANHKFTHYQIIQDSNTAKKINVIKERSDSKLILGTESGLFLFDPISGDVQSVDFFNDRNLPLSALNVVSLLLDEKENIYVGTRYWKGGLFYLDTVKNISFHFTNSNKFFEDYGLAINGMIQNTNELLVLTNQGVFRVEDNWMRNSDSKNEVLLSENTVKLHDYQLENMFIDSKSNTWMGRFDETLLLRNIDGKVTELDIQNQFRTKFSSLAVTHIFEDRSGIMWFGTNGGGLFKLAPNSTTFNSVDRFNTFQNKSIRGVFIDSKDRLWVGGYSGFEVFSPDGEYRQVSKVGIADLVVWDFYQDPHEPDVFWVATEGEGIIKYNYLTNSVIDIYFSEDTENFDEKNRINAVAITAIMSDSDGSIWIGTEWSVEKYNPIKDKFELIEFPECNSAIGTFHRPVQSIVKSNYIWLPSESCGLYLLHRESLSKQLISFLLPDKSIQSFARILSVHEDELGNLWIGTSSGLYKSDLSTFDFNSSELKIEKVYSISNGLNNDHINGILEDERHVIWVSTNSGIIEINPFTDEIRNFDINDGLQQMEFNRSAYFQSNDGTMIFGGINGIDVFHPSNISKNKQKPETVITDVLLMNKSYRNNPDIKQDINDSRSITLSHDQNFLTFQYAGMDFTDPLKNKYAYKLEGFNEDWFEVKGKTEAVFTNLDPGKYIFMVKASNNDGVWNEVPLEIAVIITPPWWRTPWAITLWLLMIVGIILGVFRVRLNRIREIERGKRRETEVKKLLELDKAKSSLFANISHEFRTPLTLILAPLKAVRDSLDSEEDKSKIDLIKKNANKLLQLVNQILDLSKLESGKLEPVTNTGDLVKYLKALGNSFNSAAESKKINYSKSYQVDHIISDFDSDHLDKIYGNLLSNAFKFTPANGKVMLELNIYNHEKGPFIDSEEVQDAWLNINVKDTGIGIDEEEQSKIFDRFYQASQTDTRNYEGTGIGLSLAKELISSYGGEIEVFSKKDWGTEMKTWFPIKVYSTSKVESDIKVPDQQPEVRDREIVLIVEDNQDLQDYIGDLMGDFEVVNAGNGIDGFEMAKNEIPDIIISDVMMPGMDGYELTQKLKSTTITSHIPIILLTAKVEREDKIEGLEAGADDYITKPFDPEELKLKVKNLLALKREYQLKLRQNISLKPSEIQVESRDQEFLKKAITVVEANIENEQFSVDDLSREVGVSRAQFHRKIKALTDHSTTYFIRAIRLERAKDLLQQGAGNVTEIAYSVGFNSHSYFTKSFTKYFGYPPSEVILK